MNETCAFGPFLFYPQRFLLLRDGQVVPVGGRALSVLAVLCERPGQFCPNSELFAKAWPDVHVDEGSLRFQINVLRRVLGPLAEGAPLIVNRPGQGYAIQGPVIKAGGIKAGVTHADDELCV